MTHTSHALLLQVLTDDYGLLKGRLARRLGSPDIADEVLQEAYLRVERMPPTIGAVLHPRTYLFRIALNIAADRRRSEQRRLARSEIELLLRLEHDELDPERVVEARSSVRTLVEALEDLPPRRRAIFVAARVNGLSIPQIAAQFSVSTRFIERELKQALDHCRDRLEIKLSRKFGPGRSETSSE
ncbi:RNA polymerase sigma factor [Bradyrhizobium cenepequi]|uniref:RNA polymerase sigma factor n=1 Tax=Bradyrhizobium cenepequi TaxID=2821403 RepID=UPI001CE3AF67|nr:RNA polymerase sigma factor [Bradyrhizobium cenepequi]MCA6106739.1 RNA polymerase sigma factor [Bradyrhizobium cenepequi]